MAQAAPNLRRLTRLAWARVSCCWYCLVHLKCELSCYDHDGRLNFLAATSGSLFTNDLNVDKIFWDETPEDIESH